MDSRPRDFAAGFRVLGYTTGSTALHAGQCLTWRTAPTVLRKVAHEYSLTESLAAAL